MYLVRKKIGIVKLTSLITPLHLKQEDDLIVYSNSL